MAVAAKRPQNLNSGSEKNSTRKRKGTFRYATIVALLSLTFWLVTYQSVLYFHTIPPCSDLDQKPLFPLNSELKDSNVDYITTITAKLTKRKLLPTSKTPNFFEIISEKKCLPTSDECDSCLHDTVEGGNCDRCHKVCGCFCDFLCKTNVQNKPVSKVVEYSSPLYERANSENEHERLIPKIVHQTWFEPVDKDKYPNFSRFTNSWKQKDWEYRFYNDEESSDFLARYFPPEVKQAYDSLIPKAFKADLFRYCVLFIHGGIYADIDVLLESDLDMIIDDDVGFMIPLDSEPGRNNNHTMCLWNGLLAAAPGHPFLAAVIEAVVNNVRNKFTRVDIMQSMCPTVDLHMTRAWDLLHITGPCILGATINRFLGRHPQTSFEATRYVDDKFPGKFIILKANKKDMGSQRFTSVEKNTVVAATDLPDSDDRFLSLGQTMEKNHYSSIRTRGEIFGSSGLYTDFNIANEMIKFEAALE